MKSIDDRLQEIRNALTLIIAGLSMDVTDCDPVSESELNEAMLAAATQAHGEAYWLTRLPESILNRPAPTADEMEKVGGAR